MKKLGGLLLLILAAGCVAKTVYVRERDKVKALAVGEVYTNESQAVEWVVPPAILTKLLKEEGK